MRNFLSLILPSLDINLSNYLANLFFIYIYLRLLSRDLKNQAKLLVKRIKGIPLQNQKWKLININIGTVDVCHYCENRISTPLKWIKDYKKALDYLYSNLRKTFVNVISIRSNSMLKVFQENYPVCKWFLK